MTNSQVILLDILLTIAAESIMKAQQVRGMKDEECWQEIERRAPERAAEIDKIKNRQQ